MSQHTVDHILDEMYQIHTCNYGSFGDLIKKAYELGKQEQKSELEKDWEMLLSEVELDVMKDYKTETLVIQAFRSRFLKLLTQPKE